MKTDNIFSKVADDLPKELIEDIVKHKNFNLQRIVSKAHATPEGQWYDQETDEWVMVLHGAASLRIDGEPDIVEMRPGDHILLPAHKKHRVEWTQPDIETVWLALHFESS